MKSLFIILFIVICNSFEIKNEMVKDGIKMLVLSKFGSMKQSFIHDECMEFVNEMKKYRNNIDEFKQNIKLYCENNYSLSLQNVCQYIIEVIIEDVKNDLLPEYINEDLCNLF